MYKLSVIIPFRCESNVSDYLILRLKNLCEILPNNDDIEFIVVDSGSTQNYSNICQQICDENGIRYIYENTRGKPFSLGGCRDKGVELARGRIITFLDVDLRMAPNFWNNLLNLLDNWGVGKEKSKILAVPCLYLTEYGTENFNKLPEVDNKYHQFYLKYLQGDKDNIESFATCSSVMLVDRFHYLSVGGHNPEFNGHGYEDFELYHRLMVEDNYIPRADDYLKDTKNWLSFEYEGFRSQLSILGRPALMMNLMVFHLWHPRPKKNSFYDPKKLIENRKRIFSSFTSFDKNRNHPQPLVTTENLYNNILFFGKKNSDSFNCLRGIFPHLGKIQCSSEYDFTNPVTREINDNFFEALSLNNINLILFPNPYANEARLKIYNWCRLNNFPYLVFERGALIDSWFLDPKGFNSDSSSYQIDFDKNLEESKKASILEYISQVKNSSKSLEVQGQRFGGEGLKNRLNISNQKILFVPLQRPSDTVIKHFCGEIKSFENFVNLIDQVAGILKSYGWVTLIKKHPLETDVPNFANAKIVPDDIHFIDLLEACDASALINSGVGVYSMMMSKPCYIFGNAFYEHASLNFKIYAEDYESEDRVNLLAARIAGKNDIVDMENVYKFISFLVHDFYSFGVSKTKERIEADNSKRTITQGISFYDIKIQSKQLIKYHYPIENQLQLSAPLFERFGLYIQSKATKKTMAPSIVKRPISKESGDSSKGKGPEKHLQSPKNKIEKIRRKVNKLRYKPYEFFNDSKNQKLRKLRVLFE